MDPHLTRREYKFRLSGCQTADVMRAIRERLPGDAHGAHGAYPIVSGYYDTLERDALWERDRKVGNRRKLRMRIYGTSNGAIPPSAFLEIKHKQDGVGVKRRIRVPVDLVAASGSDIAGFLGLLKPTLTRHADVVVSHEITRMLEDRGLVPSIQMRYDRLAFEDPEGGVRVTFDGLIKCRIGHPALRPDHADFPLNVLPPDECVMEVKLCGAAPFWLREMVGRFQLTRTSISKYCTALQLHDPVLAHLRAHRHQAA